MLIQHNISANNISPNALTVLNNLNQAGFSSYLVGGSVRDLILGLRPKDFDIATEASPLQVKKVFNNCRIIGKRFKLAHVYFGREIIDVATFRGGAQEHHSETGMVICNNNYGSIDEDVWRRDFTVNALYYDVENYSIIDFTDGYTDLQHKVLRIVGDPSTRYREDPVRMLRALRFAGKLDFVLEKNTADPINDLAHLLCNVSSSRLLEEILKWFLSKKSLETFKLMFSWKLFATLFPQTNVLLENDPKMLALVLQGFTNTDQRLLENKSLNPAFIFAFLLWPAFQFEVGTYMKRGYKLFQALHLAMQVVLQEQIKLINIPHYLIYVIKEIWLLQYHFLQSNPRKNKRAMQHPKFRAAYDFLLLRQQSGEGLDNLIAKWGVAY